MAVNAGNANDEGPVKLEIQVEQAGSTLSFSAANAIKVAFNPHTLAFSRTVNWRKQGPAQRDVPELHFDHAEPRTLTIDLLFDTYDNDDPEDQKQDVREQTKKIYHLTTVEQHGDKHRPPVCRLTWGKQGYFFQGVLESVSEQQTLFNRNGRPVRAKLNCRFKEWRTNYDDLNRQRTSSADVAKRHVFKRGETLSRIAALLYEDPRLWRPIAVANDIDDPAAVEPGTVLFIPTLGPQDRPTRRPL